MNRTLEYCISLSIGFFGASQGVAQPVDFDSASMRTCNVLGSVSVTVLGITTTTPIGCLNEAEQTTPGEDSSSITGDIDVSAPGFANMANLSAPNGIASYSIDSDTTVLTGLAAVENIDIAQDMVSASTAQGEMSCEYISGNDFLECQGDVSIDSLHLNDNPVSLPDPIPYGYTIPASGNLQVSVLGLLPVSVPVSGNLKLNEIVVTGATPEISGSIVKIPISPGNDTQVEQNSLRLSVSGSINILGIGLINIEMDIIDYVCANYTWPLPS